MPLVDVVILTHQEELNLPHALRSLTGLDCAVFVVDSGSTDQTVQIAQACGARVFMHPFESQARQVNWALDALPLTAPWTLRLDADERLTGDLAQEIGRVLPQAPADLAAYLIKRRVHFWGRWIRFGGYYPTWLLRLWRAGKARSEDVWMDEHMVVTGGSIGRLQHDLIDENRKGLTFWIDKHNRYSDREIMAMQTSPAAAARHGFGGAVGRRRFLKRAIYGRSPLFLRAIAYALLRYFVLLGFLDGRAGFVFHFLQGFWYRLVIDAKIYESRIGRSNLAKADAGSKTVPVSDRL